MMLMVKEWYWILYILYTIIILDNINYIYIGIWHMLWAECVLKKSYLKDLNPSVAIFGDGVSKKAIKIKWGYKSGAQIQQDLFLMRRDTRKLTLCLSIPPHLLCTGRQGPKRDPVRTERRLPSDSSFQPYWHLALKLPASRAVKKQITVSF